jgi:hypothetical protein
MAAKKRKPAIEGKTRGAGNWGDETVGLIVTALRGVKGKAKQKQAERIMEKAKKASGYSSNRLYYENAAQAKIGKIYKLESRLSGQQARSMTYRRKKGYPR